MSDPMTPGFWQDGPDLLRRIGAAARCALVPGAAGPRRHRFKMMAVSPCSLFTRTISKRGVNRKSMRQMFNPACVVRALLCGSQKMFNCFFECLRLLVFFLFV